MYKIAVCDNGHEVHIRGNRKVEIDPSTLVPYNCDIPPGQPLVCSMATQNALKAFGKNRKK